VPASIASRVIDAQTGEALAGAKVTIGAVSALTDANGAFAIENLPPGNQVATISAAGHRTLERPFALTTGTNTAPAIPLNAEAVALENLVVTAPTSDALSKFEDRTSSDATTEIVSETSLKNPNAQNSSDFMKDVSGVAVSKGANGSSNVSVRGIDQRMLRITVDGQRQGGTGNPLDNIPAEVVQSLEVTKTFTPDMEADAVGGVININTGGTIIRDPYRQGRHQVSYNPLASGPSTRNSFTVGQPYTLFSSEQNASALVTASFEDQYSTRERLSALREWTPQLSPGPAPYTGQEIPVLTLPVIESTNEHRQRTGIILNSDARFGDLALFWRSNFGRDWARRNRKIDDTDPASGTVQALAPTFGVFSGVASSRRGLEQTTQRDAINLSFGAKSRVGSVDLDGTLGYVLTQEDEPHTLETGFISDGRYRLTYDLANPYAPKYTLVNEADATDTTSVNDPARYRFDYLNLIRGDVDERDGSFKFNAKLNLQDGGDYLKFGGKAQRRSRTVNAERTVYDPGAQVRSMAGLVGTPFVSQDTTGYRFGPIPSASGVADLLGQAPDAFAENGTQSRIGSNTGDYTVDENLWALYGMGKFRFGAWSLLGGVRVEGTSVDSAGRQMLLDGQGQLQGFQYAHAQNSYVEILPGLHLRYEPRPGLLYRGSITRSMSRPNSADIAPYRTLSFIDHRSRIGAPDLKPYLSTNLDLSVDKYDDAYGLLSFAVFYKKIDHFITDAQYPVVIGDLGTFIEFKRINGEAARAVGCEVSWQSQQWTLPVTLGRASLEANYSFNHGTAHYPTRPGETFPLPRQVDGQGGLKLHNVNGAFSVDAGVTYRSGWWEDQIAPGLDNYIDSSWDAEISGSYQLGKGSRITAGISNVLNRPTRHYAGDPSRMNDWQRSGVDMNIGVQWKL
jgi:TonB-dependent receptor